MNVTCPECRSIFRVDPARVPQGGVRARCSVCGGVIAVQGAEMANADFLQAVKPPLFAGAAAGGTAVAEPPARVTAPPPRFSGPQAPVVPVVPATRVSPAFAAPVPPLPPAAAATPAVSPAASEL